MLKRCLLCLLLALLLPACSKSASTPLPTITPASAGTATALVLPPLPDPTATPAGSPTPFASFEVNPAVEGLMLRIGPGVLFDALQMLGSEATLTVLGKSPGGEWLKVQSANGTLGWVFAGLVKSSVDLRAIPVIEPQGIVTIKGRVVDIVGTPIEGIGFEVKPEGAEASAASVASTDANGEFFAFLPEDASGTWTVTQTAIGCPSNIWTDSSCSAYKAGYIGTVEPNIQTVSLPQSGRLEFTWK